MAAVVGGGWKVFFHILVHNWVFKTANRLILQRWIVYHILHRAVYVLSDWTNLMVCKTLWAQTITNISWNSILLLYGIWQRCKNLQQKIKATFFRDIRLIANLLVAMMTSCHNRKPSLNLWAYWHCIKFECSFSRWVSKLIIYVAKFNLISRVYIMMYETRGN